MADMLSRLGDISAEIYMRSGIMFITRTVHLEQRDRQDIRHHIRRGWIQAK